MRKCFSLKICSPYHNTKHAIDVTSIVLYKVFLRARLSDSWGREIQNRRESVPKLFRKKKPKAFYLHGWSLRVSRNCRKALMATSRAFAVTQGQYLEYILKASGFFFEGSATLSCHSPTLHSRSEFLELQKFLNQLKYKSLCFSFIKLYCMVKWLKKHGAEIIINFLSNFLFRNLANRESSS